MSPKSVHFSPGLSSQSTKYGSDGISDDSSKEETPETKPFSIAEAFQNMLLGSCNAPAACACRQRLPAETVTVTPRREEPTKQLPMLLGDRPKPQQLPTPTKPPAVPKTRYNFDRLEHLALLGYGAFGTVTLVKCHVTGQTMALKKMSKGMVLQNNMGQHVKNEKLAMQRACSPFIIKLAACFNCDQHIYFLMEAATGGDLFSFYTKTASWGSEAHARFYVACLTSALSHLHDGCIIYRDVKLENVVLDARGYAKLCDFGVARFVEPSDSRGGRRRASAKAYTTCGTPEYMAPETVGSRGYSESADWWSLGVLAFSILTGKWPFNAKDPKDIIVKARAGINRVKFPEDREWPELVQGLCAKDPYERLPIQDGGLRNIHELAWYRSAHFDWNAHETCIMPAPYVPPAKGPNGYCDVEVEDMEPPPDDVRYVDNKEGSSPFADFEDLEGPSRFDM